MEFQKKAGLTQDGIVDKTVFDFLYEEYIKTKIIKKGRDISEQNDIFPFEFNDYGEHIKDFNSKLVFLLNYFDIYHSLRESSIYSSATDKAVREAEKIFGMPRGAVDELFIFRLDREIESIKSYQK